MTAKRCKNCKKEKDLSKFHLASGGYRQSTCKECESEYHREWYKANKDRVKKQVRLRSKKNIDRNKKIIIGHLEDHPCADCGSTEIEVLQFDHLPQYEKKFDVGGPPDVSQRVLLDEIAKCDVVCPTCHVRRTLLRNGGSWRSLMKGKG